MGTKSKHYNFDNDSGRTSSSFARMTSFWGGAKRRLQNLFIILYNFSMVRTRIAPSPTGEDIHIGNLYTALINWSWAKKNHGKFIVRIEDTDRTRLVENSEQKILQTLKNFGLNYDEGPDVNGPYKPYRQSERLSLYKKYIEQLISKGAAYYCTCSKQRLDEIRLLQQKQKQVPKYDKHCRNIKH